MNMGSGDRTIFIVSQTSFPIHGGYVRLGTARAARRWSISVPVLIVRV